MAARYMGALYAAIDKNPAILKSTGASIYSCVIHSMSTSLMPGPMQECAIVPFFDSKKKATIATFMPMVQGLAKLMLLGSFVKDIHAKVVYTNDEFDYNEGSRSSIHFKSFKGDPRDRGDKEGVFCILTTKYDTEQITYLTKYEVEALKARSKAAKSESSPWNHPDDVVAMWVKSAVKRASKLVPKDLFLARALELDNRAESLEPQGENPIFGDNDFTVIPPDPETPENNEPKEDGDTND